MPHLPTLAPIFEDANDFFGLPQLPRPTFALSYCINGYAAAGLPFSTFQRGALYALPAAEAGTFERDIRAALQYLYDAGDLVLRRRLLRCTAKLRAGANPTGGPLASACTILYAIQIGRR